MDTPGRGITLVLDVVAWCLRITIVLLGAYSVVCLIRGLVFWLVG